MMSAAIEYDDRPGAIRDRVIFYQTRLRKELARAIGMAIDTGELRADTDSAQLAFEIFGVELAMHHDSRLFGFDEAIDAQRTRARSPDRVLSRLIPEDTAMLLPAPRLKKARSFGLKPRRHGSAPDLPSRAGLHRRSRSHALSSFSARPRALRAVAPPRASTAFAATLTLDVGGRNVEVYRWGDPTIQPYVLVAHGWSDLRSVSCR